MPVVIATYKIHYSIDDDYHRHKVTPPLFSNPDAIHSVIVGPASTRLETTTDYSADIDEGRVAQEINNEQWSAAQETNVDAPSELVPSGEN